MDMCKKSTLFLLFGADFLVVIVRAKTPHLQTYRNSQRTVARSMHPYKLHPYGVTFTERERWNFIWYYRYKFDEFELGNCEANSETHNVFSYLHFRINIRINRVMIFIMLGMARYKAVSRNTFSHQDNGHHIKRVLPGPVDQSCPNN